ncbi:hypothetical protein OG339_24165 [Streptosporangium sp. NBC_01495]|uniref:hypothetical protein n=1 Tax=Streptosporangium sp. NBC_01495 TaxID=2903899 RepID=UPI002E31A41C|nr:hypothetical protein [Streptosporangium sp. NBC_01495]
MSADLEGERVSRAAEEAGGPAVDAVSCHEDLVKLLAEQFARADVSLRELQARADRAGGTRLPRATCADMLAGRRFPKKAVMTAFLRACQVSEHRLPAWERAWERARIARMPAAPEPGRVIEPAGGTESGARPVGPGRWGAIRVPGRGRRRAALPVLAVLALPAAAVTLIVIAGLREAPRSVTDDGRAFGRGGSSRFTVNVDPAHAGVRLIRRLDANVPLQRAAISVNGAPAGEWKPLLGGTYGWVDQSVDIPSALTAGRSSLTVVNTFVSSVWDFNEFRYVVEQKVDGVWSTADTIDVGHAGSEAAHGYRIAGETFHGVRTFDYPRSAERAR